MTKKVDTQHIRGGDEVNLFMAGMSATCAAVAASGNSGWWALIFTMISAYNLYIGTRGES